MKLSPLLLGAAFFVGGFVQAVEIGDSKDDVLRELGEPTAFSDLGHKAIMMYAEGKVVLVDDAVTSTTVPSREELARREAAERERRARVAAERTAARQARIEEGTRMLAELQANERFQQSSPRRRLSILESFQTRYPEVEIDHLIIPARVAARDELQAEGEALASSLRLDPKYLETPWHERLRILQDFSARYPDVNVDDLKAVVLKDRDQAMREQRQREEIARLRREAAEARALRLEEQRRREATEDALRRAQNETRRAFPVPVYIPVPSNIPVPRTYPLPQTAPAPRTTPVPQTNPEPRPTPGTRPQTQPPRKPPNGNIVSVFSRDTFVRGTSGRGTEEAEDETDRGQYIRRK